MDCMIWTKSKINYAFVFEYDTRHTLEWRQLLEVSTDLGGTQIRDVNIAADSILFLLLDGPLHVA